LYQNDGLLADSSADDIDIFDEDSEDLQEPMSAGISTSEVTSVVGPILTPERRVVEAIDAVELCRLLTEQRGTSVDTVVVDCRPYLAYSSSHVVGAHNVCFPSLLERRRLRRQAVSGSRVPPIPLENIVRCDEVRQAVVDGRCRRVVVYDEETNSIRWPADVDRCGSQLISVLRSLADCTSCELQFIRGLLSYMNFERFYCYYLFSIYRQL